MRFKKDDKEFKGDISVVDKDNALDFWVYESEKELHEDVKSGRFKRLVPRYQEGKICVGGRGIQLVRASNELKGAIKGIDKESVKTLGRKQGMLWEFTPAEAPWMNGVTESLVKSVRVALSHAIGEQVLEFSTLQTVLFEAAELVNSRSIGRHPTDPDGGVYLSPNDLLLGRSTSRAPRGPLLEISGCAIQSYFVISG